MCQVFVDGLWAIPEFHLRFERMKLDLPVLPTSLRFWDWPGHALSRTSWQPARKMPCWLSFQTAISTLERPTACERWSTYLARRLSLILPPVIHRNAGLLTILILETFRIGQPPTSRETTQDDQGDIIVPSHLSTWSFSHPSVAFCASASHFILQFACRLWRRVLQVLPRHSPVGVDAISWLTVGTIAGQDFTWYFLEGQMICPGQRPSLTQLASDWWIILWCKGAWNKHSNLRNILYSHSEAMNRWQRQMVRPDDSQLILVEYNSRAQSGDWKRLKPPEGSSFQRSQDHLAYLSFLFLLGSEKRRGAWQI